jgi:hypothetical protein
MRPVDPPRPSSGDPPEGARRPIFDPYAHAPRRARGRRRGVPAWGRWTIGGVAGLAAAGALIGGPWRADDEPAAATANDRPAAAPVDVDIASPADASTFRTNVAIVNGTVDPPDAHVEVNGGPPRDLGAGRWQKRVRLDLGDQDIDVRAWAPDRASGSDSLTVTRRRSEEELEQYRAMRAAREQRFRADATWMPYDELEKDPEALFGAKVTYTGQIVRVEQDRGGGWMLLAVTDGGDGFWTDSVYVEYAGPLTAAEEDVITVFGTVQGRYSYRSQVEGETFLPHLRARYIDE